MERTNWLKPATLRGSQCRPENQADIAARSVAHGNRNAAMHPIPLTFGAN